MQVVLFEIAARNMEGVMPALLRFARPAIVGPLEAWWATALLLEYGSMSLMDMAGWRILVGHFSERQGLIFIIALGEAVVSIGIGSSGLALDHGVIIRPCSDSAS